MTMKMYTTTSASEKVFLQEWLLGTIQETNCEVISHEIPRDLTRTQKQTALHKARFILEALKKNAGEIIVYTDVATQFFQSIQKKIEDALQSADIAFLKDDPNGISSAGFFAARCTHEIITLWEEVVKRIQETQWSQQENFLGHLIQSILLETQDIRWSLLPHTFFGCGTFTGRLWGFADNIYIPKNMVLHQANWVKEKSDREIQLQRVRHMAESEWYKSNQSEEILERTLRVPGYAQPKTYPEPYPAHQKSPDIERAFYEYWCNEITPEIRNSMSRTYIPVLWTYMYAQKNSQKKKELLQRWLRENLDPEKSYWTIIKSADGILEDLPENVLIYSAGGKGDIPIPLLCDLLPAQERARDIRASFVGVIHNSANNKTGVRTKMLSVFTDNKNVQITEARDNAELFQEMLSRSVFSLCPRGYGKTSYRFYEALRNGSIPIYIYDDPWLPYEDELDWDKYCIRVHENDIETIPDLLVKMTNADINRMQENIANMVPQYCTTPKICEYIVKNLLGKRGPKEFIRQNAYSTYHYPIITK